MKPSVGEQGQKGVLSATVENELTLWGLGAVLDTTPTPLRPMFLLTDVLYFILCALPEVSVEGTGQCHDGGVRPSRV